MPAMIIPLVGAAAKAALGSGGGSLLGGLFSKSMIGEGILGGLSGLFGGRSQRKQAKREFEWKKELMKMEQDFQMKMIEDARRHRSEHWARWAAAGNAGQQAQPEQQPQPPGLIPGIGAPGAAPPMGGGMGAGGGGGVLGGAMGNSWVGNNPQIPQQFPRAPSINPM